MGNKMLGMMGCDPKDLLSDAEIEKVLTATFNKFDNDGSGELEQPEFRKAFKHLGLEGSVAEQNRALKEVDVDGSGKIGLNEFKNAIKNSRSAELSLTVILQNMDGQLEGLGDIFSKYRNKLEESRLAAEKEQQDMESRYKNY